MSKGFTTSYRIALLASLMLAMFAGLEARLVWLHVIDRDQLLRSVDEARRQLIADYARRGDIVDDHGALLATSRSIVILGVDPQFVRNEDRTKLPELASLIGVTVADLQRTCDTKTRSPGKNEAQGAPAAGSVVITLNSHVPADAPAAVVDTDAARNDDTELDEPDKEDNRPIRWAKLSDQVPESVYAQVTKLGIRGVYGRRVYRRDYPHNEMAAHIVGYVDSQERPVAGIEHYADFYLRGENGWLESEKDGKSHELAQFRTREVPAVDGFNVTLSIDATVQHIAEDELAKVAEQYEPEKATIIVSDPQTGFILALANYPTFDLNTFNKLSKEDQRRMRNIAVADEYEPGSVFKIVAVSGALNDGLVTTQSEFDCTLEKIDYNGITRSLPREDSSDHFDHPLSVTEIIEHSSNKGAAQLAMRLGDQRFYDYARAFGFGQPTGFPVGGEAPGNLKSPDKWDSMTITRMPMGQSVTATALQMQQAMGVIASGGLLLRPQVIRQIRDSNGELVYNFGRIEQRRVISEQTALTMARLLTGVVSPQGNAPLAAIAGFECAGKTGTAQKLLPVTLASGATVMRYSDKHHVASFIGFFPASHPQVSIAIIIDDADARCPGGVAFGNQVAAPVFKRLGERLIPYLDIRPTIDNDARHAFAMGGGAVIGYLVQDHALVRAFRDRPLRRSTGDYLEYNRAFKMAPILSDYISENEALAVKGSLARPISGLVMDSRRVVPGNLFFALPGLRSDGMSFVDEAVSRGAAAVVAQRIPAHPPAKVTFIQVADARAMLARVSQRFYRFPDRELTVIGVTGTNGKTTVAHLIRNFLNEHERVGLLGTISYDLGARTVPSFRTTPESLDIFGMLAQMRDAGCRSAVMEVSSHGIAQERVLGLEFGAAVFTNLTRDHLDFHKTLESYFEVKTRLFTGGTGPVPKVAVVNLDDPHGEQLAARIAAEVPSARLVTFGENPRAQVRAEDVVLNFRDTTLTLAWPGGSLPVESPLIGRYNVSNLLAAAATAWGLGREPAVFLPRIRGFKGVPGRMERIEEGQPFNVLVDYAHTDDALRNALGMLRAITPGRLLVVFGCGGNRDRTKRPAMVRAVQDIADHAFATADNPRGEQLGRIFADMREGVVDPSRITWVDDRRRAISVALDSARAGDSLLIAGKGHEGYQEFADTVIPFDDRQVVRELIGVKALRN